MRNEQKISDLSQRFDVHQNMICSWKKELVDNAADIFDKGHKSRKKVDEKIDELYRQIGHLKAENDFLSRVLGS